jgi:hypothetical protein
LIIRQAGDRAGFAMPRPLSRTFAVPSVAWMAAMKVLIVLLLIASHHSSKQHKLQQRDVEQLQLPPIEFIMPAWCSVPETEEYGTRCMVYRI